MNALRRARIRAHIYTWALLRKLSRWIGIEAAAESHPADAQLQPSDLSQYRVAQMPLSLAYDKCAAALGTQAWQQQARAKLCELLGVEEDADGPQSNSTWQRQLPSRYGAAVTATRYYLRRPNQQTIPVTVLTGDVAAPPLIIAQGTFSGANLAWGEARQPFDLMRLANRADNGLQAVANGFAAICVEMMSAGERAERRFPGPNSTVTAAESALLFGHTLLGDRVSDMIAVRRWLASGGAGEGVTLDAPWVLGHSAGGSVALHWAAADTHVGGCIASGSVGLVRETLLTRPGAGGQNTVPSLLRWMELDDVAGLVAPRPLLVVSGDGDHIWPFAGAQAVVESARRVYAELGASHRIQAAMAHGPHRFHPTPTWQALAALRAACQDPQKPPRVMP